MSGDAGVPIGSEFWSRRLQRGLLCVSDMDFCGRVLGDVQVEGELAAGAGSWATSAWREPAGGPARVVWERL